MRTFLAAFVITAMLAVSGPTRSAFAQDGHASASPTVSPYVIQLQPAKEPPSPAMLKFRQKVVFVVVLGDDNTANKAKVAVAMAHELEDSIGYPVVPEAGWDIPQYVQQCQKDPEHTQGAFLVLPPASGNKTYDWLVLIRNAVDVLFNAMISECPGQEAVATAVPAATTLPIPNPNATGPPPDVAWVAHTVTGEFGRSVLQFLPFAVLTSVYLAFAPQRLYQTVTTHVIPTPNPLPAGGSNTNVQTTSATTLNPSGTSTLQNNIVTSVAAASLDFGRTGDVNHLTTHASEDAAHQFFGLLRRHCNMTLEPDGTVEQDTPPDDGTKFCKWLMPRVGTLQPSAGVANGLELDEGGGQKFLLKPGGGMTASPSCFKFSDLRADMHVAITGHYSNDGSELVVEHFDIYSPPSCPPGAKSS